MKMFTEQYLNYRLAPMTINRRKKQTYPHSVCGTTYYSGSFDAECFMIADLIATIALQLMYNNRDGYVDLDGHLDYSRKDPKVVERMSKRSKETRNYSIENWKGNHLPPERLSMYIEFSKLKKRFEFLYRYRDSCDMTRALQKVSTCNLGFNYYVRYLQSTDPVQYGIKYFDFSGSPMSLFKLEIDNKKYHRGYNLIFDNYFNLYFLQNVTGIFVRQIDSKLYSCSNYSQLLYRYIISNINNDVTFIDRLITKFGMTEHKNEIQIYRQIETWLKELRGMNLISDFSIEDNKIKARPDISNPQPDMTNPRLDISEKRVKVINTKGL